MKQKGGIMDSRQAHPLEMLRGTCVRTVSLLLVVLAMSVAAAGAAAAGPSLLVTSQLDHTVKEYDGTTGAFVRNAAAGVGDPLDAIIGADGNLLVTDGQQDAVKRFDRTTGTLLDIFAGAVSPLGMTMSGGKVYVCQTNPPEIIRSFDALTGADVGSFIPTVGQGNPSPRDVKVANGRLYVSYWNLGTIEMFDVTTRQSLGLLFPAGTGGLVTPFSIAFGPDGNLYVSYGFFVNRYHPTTGAFLGRFVDTGDRTGQRYAVGIAWGPDGNLYVATQNTAGVQRYNGSTGAFMDDFVPPGSGGLTAPFHISFTSVNRAPDCSAAAADPPELWPPDHELVPVAIVGVTDPDGDPVTIAVTGVTQDESLNEDGDGNTCPDAVLVAGAAQVRAERSSRDNGRVYRVSFTASDGRGGSCNGLVHVCVPHDQGQDPPSVVGKPDARRPPSRVADDEACMDDGQGFNSLGPCSPQGSAAPTGITLTVIRRTGNAVTLEYSLPAARDVVLALYDLAGRRVRMLEHAPQGAGAHSVSWNTTAVSRGIYFYRLQAGSVTVTKSVFIVK